MNIPLDAIVHAKDGRCGRSTYIIYNPTSEKLTHIVIRERQPSRIERIAPVKFVENTATDVILLNCTKNEFFDLEKFNQKEFIFSDVPQYSDNPDMTLLWPYVTSKKRLMDDTTRKIPPGELALRRGARVRATDGWSGKVDEFIVDLENGYFTHLVIREGNIFGKKSVCIPVSKIESIEEKIIVLKLNKKEIASLPDISLDRCWD